MRSTSSEFPARRKRATAVPPSNQRNGPRPTSTMPGGDERRRVVTGPDGHADGGHDPEAGRRGQPADREALADDRAGAEEADTGDDLRGDPGRVEDDALGVENWKSLHP